MGLLPLPAVARLGHDESHAGGAEVGGEHDVHARRRLDQLHRLRVVHLAAPPPPHGQNHQSGTHQPHESYRRECCLPGWATDDPWPSCRSLVAPTAVTHPPDAVGEDARGVHHGLGLDRPLLPRQRVLHLQHRHRTQEPTSQPVPLVSSHTERWPRLQPVSQWGHQHQLHYNSALDLFAHGALVLPETSFANVTPSSPRRPCPLPRPPPSCHPCP
jgi:hypothetical protein